MSDWQSRVRRHLRAHGTELPDPVVEELADHLEDAWDARPSPSEVTDADTFAADAMRRADVVALGRRPTPAPLPPAPEPGSGASWSGLGGELRHALRLLGRAPAFTAAVVAVLALGIGATTSAFELVYTALLAPLPYADADRLVMVWEHNLTRGRPRNVINPGNYFAWSERSTSLAAAGVFSPTVGNLSGDGGAPEELRGVAVQPRTLGIVGARPMSGRLFVEADGAAGAPRTLLISEGLWQRRFGGVDVVGKAVVMNGEPATIVGVLPAGFTLVGFGGEFWRPASLPAEARTNFRGRSLMSVARLRTGVSPEAAQQELASVFADLVREHPDFNTGWTLNVVPLREQLTSETRPALWVLFGAVLAVLLIACANVAALLLVRATGRTHEMAVKVSLGARPVHLARQLALETVLLVGAGGVLGAVLAQVLTKVVSATAREAGVPLATDGTLGGAALAFAVAVTALTAVVCGLGPALRARRTQVNQVLREGGRGGVGGGRQRLRGWLVAGEVAAATLILTAAALLGRSYLALQDVDPGFSAEQVLTARVSRMGRAAQTTEVAFGHDVVARLRALPGVTAAAATSFLPLDGNPGIGSSFFMADRPEPAAGERPVADYRPVTPGYFAALQIPLKYGRDFTDADVDGRQRVAIVNEAFVRLLSADVPAIGRCLSDSLGEMQEIVGVVGDVTLASLGGEFRPTIYLPFAQLPVGSLTFVVRAAGGEPGALGRAVEGAVRAVDPNQPVSDIRPLDAVVSRSLFAPRVASAALGLFATLALLLAAIGVYGVVAYGVSQRRSEFGVRLALGAEPKDVVRLVVSQSMTMVLGGILVGALLAVPLSSALRSLLFGVGPGDPLTLAAVVIVLVAAGVLASYVPARSGTRVDPVETLRTG